MQSNARQRVRRATRTQTGWYDSPWKIAGRALGTALFIVLISAILALAVIPRVMGGDSLTVLSGSMEPTFSAGDVVVVRGIEESQVCDDVTVGDIVTFFPAPNDPTLVTHRVVGKTIGTFEDGTGCRLITQGDANSAADEPVSPAQVRGVFMYGVPQLGWARQWVGDNLQIVLYVGAGALVLWGLWSAFRRPKTTVSVVSRSALAGAGMPQTPAPGQGAMAAMTDPAATATDLAFRERELALREREITLREREFEHAVRLTSQQASELSEGDFTEGDFTEGDFVEGTPEQGAASEAQEASAHGDSTARADAAQESFEDILGLAQQPGNADQGQSAELGKSADVGKSTEQLDVAHTTQLAQEKQPIRASQTAFDSPAQGSERLNDTLSPSEGLPLEEPAKSQEPAQAAGAEESAGAEQLPDEQEPRAAEQWEQQAQEGSKQLLTEQDIHERRIDHGE